MATIPPTSYVSTDGDTDLLDVTIVTSGPAAALLGGTDTDDGCDTDSNNDC